MNVSLKKNLYQVNRLSLGVTLILLFTFWGGIIALPLLGLIQIIISLIISYHFNQLAKINQLQFIIYLLLTLSLIVFFVVVKIEFLLSMFIWLITSFLLGCYHLYVTFKIFKL